MPGDQFTVYWFLSYTCVKCIMVCHCSLMQTVISRRASSCFHPFIPLGTPKFYAKSFLVEENYRVCFLLCKLCHLQIFQIVFGFLVRLSHGEFSKSKKLQSISTLAYNLTFYLILDLTFSALNGPAILNHFLMTDKAFCREFLVFLSSFQPQH